jgi:hypothetical protein
MVPAWPWKTLICIGEVLLRGRFVLENIDLSAVSEKLKIIIMVDSFVRSGL